MLQIPSTQKIESKKQTSTIFLKKRGRHFTRGGIQTTAHQEGAYASHIRIWQVSFLWMLFFLVLIYQVFFSRVLTIEHIVVDGAGLLTSDEVKQMTQTALSENIWTFVPQNNFLLLSTHRIEGRLLAASPLIRQVTVQKSFPNTISISILERGNFLFWCSAEESCLLVNEEGVLQDRPEALEEYRAPHIYLVDEMRKPVVTGEHVVTAQFLSFVSGLSQAFSEQADILIQEKMFLPSKYADELRIETDKNFSLRITPDIPIEQTLNTLRIVREKAIPKDRSADLVAVDLRISGKAFYQLRNEAPQETTDDTLNQEPDMSSQE